MQRSASLKDIMVSVLSYLKSISRPIWLDMSDNTLRVKATTCSTVTTVTTVTTVSSVNQLAGFDAKQTIMYSVDRTNWAQNTRSRIN